MPRSPKLTTTDRIIAVGYFLVAAALGALLLAGVLFVFGVA